MNPQRIESSSTPPSPPSFVMWDSTPDGEATEWKRHWFGHELDAKAVFNVRGIGIREPMFNADVDRPLGTGDWLIMFFHKAARLDPDKASPSVPAKTLVLWPPGVRQFYSWGEHSAKEPHTWMHVEGSWVQRQIDQNRLPANTPIALEDSSLMTVHLESLMTETRMGRAADQRILQNLFENWARSIARHIRSVAPANRIPDGLLRVQHHLDTHFTSQTPLDELTKIAAMSRSYLCHQFRDAFDSSISEYVIRKRMSAAQRMLFDLSLRPGEIAEAVGYPDIYQFSKQFKKSFGLSPTQYRKQQVTGIRQV